MIGGGYVLYHLYYYYSYRVKSQKVLNKAIEVLFERNGRKVKFDIRPELDVKAILAMDIE